MFSIGRGEYSLLGIVEGIQTLSEVLGILYNRLGVASVSAGIQLLLKS